MNFETLNVLKQKAMLNMTAKLNSQSIKKEIVVCGNRNCHQNGSGDVFDAFKSEIDKEKLKKRVDVKQVGCLGLCALGPIIVVYPDKTFYCKVKPGDVGRILKEHIVNGKVVTDLLYNPQDSDKNQISKIDFYKKQVFVARKNLGYIDPLNIMDYIAFDGYVGLYKALSTMMPEGVISQIKASGLRGRGGIGFPTGKKWELARNFTAKDKVVICNGDEGDPSLAMDRSILENDPHAVVEAMAIAGYAVGASEGVICIRNGYNTALKCIEKAIKEAYKYGFLGDNIFETNFCFNLSVKVVDGAFVNEEEPFMYDGSESADVMVNEHVKNYEFLAKPAVVNNVETLINVPAIIFNGASWYNKYGTETSKGTKIFSLSGDVNYTGLVEVPMGTTLHELVYDVGGGIKDGKRLKAIMIGGPGGSFIPAQYLNTKIDFESLKNLGVSINSGGIIVLNENACVVDIARYFMSVSVSELCGKCTPCRVGDKRMLELLTAICNGSATMSDLDELKEIAEYVKASSLCGLGQMSPNPVLSSLKYFNNEYVAHINGVCPAGKCKFKKGDKPCK